MLATWLLFHVNGCSSEKSSSEPISRTLKDLPATERPVHYNGDLHRSFPTALGDRNPRELDPAHHKVVFFWMLRPARACHWDHQASFVVGEFHRASAPRPGDYSVHTLFESAAEEADPARSCRRTLGLICDVLVMM
jgi:hypothetical protein